MNYKDYIDAANSILEAQKEIQHKLDKFPQEYFYKKMIGYTEALFEKFSPFRVGDKVMLAETPEINEATSWGWLGSKHFLVKGAVGNVVAVDYADDEFFVVVEFDNETWKDHNGGLNAPREKHGFCFASTWFHKIEIKK